MQNKSKPIILSRRTVADTQIFNIEELHLRFSNGVERYYERIRGHKRGSVMMVPMLDNDTVLLVREYGAGIEDYFLSLPKGLLEDGEDLYAAANRELMEEVGYGAHKFSPLKALSSAPGYMASRMQILLAQDLYPQKLMGDEPEPIEVVPWRLSDLSTLVAREEFTDARSIAALFIVKEMLHG